VKDSVFSGQLGLAYITTLTKPSAGFAVAVPKPGGGFARRNFLNAASSFDSLLQAALAWRDEKHRELHGHDVPVRAFHHRQANSITGVSGVRQCVKQVKKTMVSGEIRSYKVQVVIAEVWLEPGANRRRPSGSRSKVFSINKHGLETALLLATQWRSEQCRLLSEVELFYGVIP
jgi:hypothetical protein